MSSSINWRLCSKLCIDYLTRPFKEAGREKQLLSYYKHLQLAASLCLLFELVAILWGKRPQNLLFFVSDFVLKRKTLRQFYECRGGKELSKVADVFHPLHKPIEFLPPSTEIHYCLPVLLSVLTALAKSIFELGLIRINARNEVDFLNSPTLSVLLSTENIERQYLSTFPMDLHE
jgi:hypothetical protein